MNFSIRHRKRLAHHLEQLESRQLLAVNVAPVTDINTNPSSLSMVDYAEVGSTTYFIASTSSSNAGLWKTDGTAAGTQLVRDFGSPNFFSPPSRLTNVNGTLFFTARDYRGEELWKSDGTTLEPCWSETFMRARPALLRLIWSIGAARFFFSATSAARGNELWKSDGTAAGTEIVRDLWAALTHLRHVS